MSDLCKSKKTEGDRLSDLPDHLIHQIISFLSPHEAAVFCLLSKRLSSAWLSFPDLNLDSTDSYWFHRQNAFLDFAAHALRRRRRLPRDATLLSLRLNFYLHADGAPHLIQVLGLATGLLEEASELAVGQRVVDLSLCCIVQFDHAIWNPLLTQHGIFRPLPDAVFSSQWIKSMVLSGIRISYRDLLVECPLLEDFCFDSCYGATGIRFSGAAKLVKRVSITRCQGLQRICVSGPESLQEFSYEGYLSALLNDDQCRIDFDAASCESLRLLDIRCSGFLTGEWLRDTAPKLVSLEKLVLKSCWKLDSVRIDNETLKHFDLKASRTLVDVHVAVAGLETFMFESGLILHLLARPTINIEGCRHLRTLKMVGGAAQRGWIKANVISNRFLENVTLSGCDLKPSPVPSSPLVLCRNLKKVELCLSTLFDNNNNNEDVDQSRIELRDFLYLFGHSNTMIISVKYSQERFVYGEKLREILSPALYGVKNLQIKASIAPMTAAPVDLVDSFLWLAPRLHSLTFLHINFGFNITPQAMFIIKFYYATDYGESGYLTTCCSNALMKCWRHDLTKVVIENLENDSDCLKNLQVYFAENIGNARVTVVQRSN